MDALKAPTELERAEGSQLAQELAKSYQRMVDWYVQKMKMSPEEALATVNEPMCDLLRERALNDSPDQVSWHVLGDLHREDPDLAVRRWEEIQEAARHELRTGFRAARKLESYGGSPWERAQFLAVLQALVDDWQPRGGMEQLLLDTIAQAHKEQEDWLHLANERLSMDSSRHELDEKQRGKWVPPRLDSAQATEQAMAMVERWNRILLRTLRALRDLRRFSPVVNIGTARQVNVGAQQVNAVGTLERVDGDGHRGVTEVRPTT